MLSVQSTTEVKIIHLKIAIIAKKVEPWQSRSKGKVMLELLFDSSGIVNVEFILEGGTVNCYKEIFHHLHNSVHHMHPELWHRQK
jgi:hypothetical protein